MRTKLRRQQQGAVLALTLIILLVLTIVGITTMNSSSIQTFLARNTQFKQISFQNAESTLTTGEAAWNAKIETCLADVSKCTADLTPGRISDVDDIDWSSIDSEGTTPYGKYVVEYLGWRPVEGENDKRASLYRITARGLGPNSQSVTYVQTVFRKCIKNDGVPCPDT